jgi:hypothetical protein
MIRKAMIKPKNDRKAEIPTTHVTSIAISPVKMSIGRKSLTNLRSGMIFLQGKPIITFPERFFLNFSGMFRKAMIKPENGRKAEICCTWPTFALLPLRCPLSTKSEDYLSALFLVLFAYQEALKFSFILSVIFWRLVMFLVFSNYIW